jgi:DNA-binding NarL/FixJ family response regulator
MVGPVREPIRVIIADLFPVMRTGLIATIEAEADMQVVATAVDRQELMSQLQAIPAHVLVTDLIAMDNSPVSLMRTIKRTYPRLGVVVFSATVDLVPEMLAAGGHAYVSHTEPDEQLHLAIRAAKAKQRCLSPQAQAYVNRCAVPTDKHRFVPRELQILKYMAQGMGTREIANYLELCDQYLRQNWEVVGLL